MGLRQLSARGCEKDGSAARLARWRRRAWARRRWRWRRSILTSTSISTSWRTGRPRKRLRERYETDYWDMMLRQGYEHILRQRPASTINMRRRVSQIQILPAAARSRFTHDTSRDPDFYLSRNSPRKSLPQEPFPPVLHRFKVYNNTMMTVSTPDLSRVDPTVAEAYRALHRAATAGAPAARAGAMKCTGMARGWLG